MTAGGRPPFPASGGRSRLAAVKSIESSPNPPDDSAFAGFRAPSGAGSESYFSGLIQTLGPGLVWAATAIGVSHLVQSTRAGAELGFHLVWVVLVANLLKYPFFEFGPRYAAATGESLLDGYARLGRWVVWIYVAVTVGTMFTVQGAVTFVTGSLATQLFGPHLSPLGYSAALMLLCGGLLVLGRYPLLDALVKVIIVLLAVSTLVAVVVAAWRGPAGEAKEALVWTPATFAFVIALVGWMPSAIDISVWHSLWTLERRRQTGHRPRLSQVLFDFNLGYFGTAALALVFLSLGALVFHGTGRELASAGGAFAGQLITVYTESLGSWSRPLIALAAFTTMFSTTLAVTDGFPRVLERATGLLRASRPAAADAPGDEPDETPEPASGTTFYWLWMAVLVTGSLLLIGAFRNRLTAMVDVATTLSFLTAPVLSWFNLRVVTGASMPAAARPGRILLALSWVGLAAGALFAGVFLAWRLGWL